MNDTIPNDEEVRIGKLDNGLRYYIRQNKKPENRAELRLIVNAGSVQEKDGQCGIAHFTEHLMFCGTKNYSKQELQNFFELSGMKYGPHVNGRTSFDETIFKLQPRTDSQQILQESFRIMSEWAGSASFDSFNIEEQRKVLMEEWRTRSGPDQRLVNKYLPKLFYGSKYAERLPIGQEHVLENTCIDSIQNFYHNWYRPNLMAVVAVGDFEVDSIEQYIQGYFGGLQNPAKFEEKEEYEVPDHDSVIVTINRDQEVSFPKVLFYYKNEFENLITINDFRQNLKASLIEKMMEQRYDELRQKKSPPILFGGAKFTALCRAKDAFTHFGFINQARIMQGFEAMATEIERARQHGFTPGELKRSKENLLSDFLNKRNEGDKMNSKIWVKELEDHFLSNESIVNPAKKYNLANELLPNISLEEVNVSFQQWTPRENLVIVIATGENDDHQVPSPKQVLTAFDSIAKVELPEYVDTFSNQKLEITHLNGGSVIDEETNEELNITKWQLSNGAEVILKPTNFKNDEILFSAFSRGGTSLYDIEDFRSIMFLSRLISMSGVGNYSQNELQKLLSDKNLELIPLIDETHEGIQGKTTPNALETMLKLNYLYFTEPRKDETAFESFKETQKMIYGNLDANPKFYFFKNLYQTLYQGHPRVQFPSEKELKNLDLDRMIEVYKERFANAGDFTFVFVGNVNADHLKPLVAEYIGGLPSNDNNENFRDNGIRYPDKTVEKFIQKGQESKATVNLSFTGNFDWNLDNRLQLKALEEMLEIGIRKKLRNRENGVYNVYVDLKKNEYPVEDYNISLRFNCSPEHTSHLTDLTLAEVQNYASNGPDELLAKKVRETMLRSHETNLEENMYWLKMLVQYYKHNDDPSDILKIKEMIKQIDRLYLQKAAASYLNQDHMVKVVMHPAPK